MYDDLALLLGRLSIAMCDFRGIELAEVEVCDVGISSTVLRSKLLLITLVEESSYAKTECFCLRPAAICEGRVVGCGRGKMPCLVGGVEASTVPVWSCQSWSLV